MGAFIIYYFFLKTKKQKRRTSDSRPELEKEASKRSAHLIQRPFMAPSRSQTQHTTPTSQIVVQNTEHQAPSSPSLPFLCIWLVLQAQLSSGPLRLAPRVYQQRECSLSKPRFSIAVAVAVPCKALGDHVLGIDVTARARRSRLLRFPLLRGLSGR